MIAFKPSTPYSVPLILLQPIHDNAYGVRAKVPDIKNGTLIFGSFKSYGGTERTVDGIYSIEDTADVETWFRPDITSDCFIALANNPTAIYRIINEPENINMRNQYLKFKVQRFKGGV